MNKINLRYKINPKIVFRREGKEAILFNSDNGNTETLNETGVFIFKLCNGKNSRESIAAKALTKYGGDKNIIKADINKFLKKLTESELVK